MLGLPFEHCNTFLLAFTFEGCNLALSSFFEMPLKKTVFTNCILHEAEFSGADLSGAVFDGCDLKRAIFDNTNLEKADFRTAFNYAFDPAQNKVKKARFSWPGVAGLLSKYDIEIG